MCSHWLYIFPIFRAICEYHAKNFHLFQGKKVIYLFSGTRFQQLAIDDLPKHPASSFVQGNLVLRKMLMFRRDQPTIFSVQDFQNISTCHHQSQSDAETTSFYVWRATFSLFVFWRRPSAFRSNHSALIFQFFNFFPITLRRMEMAG